LGSPFIPILRNLALALVLLGAAASSAAPVQHGSIAGELVVVRASSRTPPPLDQVVVYLEDAPSGAEAPKGPFEMAQENAAFTPPLLVVPVGATVTFPNRDAYAHNVFSPAVDAAFDLGFYRRGVAKAITFQKPGVVPVYCNIHPQMAANLVVVPNPHYARVDRQGRFRMEGVPVGTWHAVIWSPFGPPARETVRVESGRETELEIVLRQRALDEPHLNKNGKEYQSYSQVLPEP
jgi:plastocyanin